MTNRQARASIGRFTALRDDHHPNAPSRDTGVGSPTSLLPGSRPSTVGTSTATIVADTARPTGYIPVMRIPRPSRRTGGILLIVASFLLWGGALSAPFLEATVATRATVGLGLYGLSYMVFGLGCKLVGDALWPMIKRRIWRGAKGGEVET